MHLFVAITSNAIPGMTLNNTVVPLLLLIWFTSWMFPDCNFYNDPVFWVNSSSENDKMSQLIIEFIDLTYIQRKLRVTF